MIKKFFACISAALMLAISSSNVCFAKTIEGPGGDVEIEFPDDFYAMYIGDKENNELTNHLDITYDTVKSYMEENDIYAGGVNDDGSIEMYAIIGDLGRDYGSLSDYDYETFDNFLESYRQKLKEKGCTNIAVERPDDNSYTLTYDMKTDTNKYHIISYNTLSGQYLYTVNVQYTNHEDYDKAKAYLDKTVIKVPEARKRHGFIDPSAWKIQWLIISLAAATVIAAAVVIIVSRKKK